MLIGCRPFSFLFKYIVQWKTSYLDIFNPFLFLSCTFKVTVFGFLRRFGRILYFCSNNGPLPNVIFSALYLKKSLLDWRLKSKEMTECLIIVDFTYIFPLITRARLKIKLRKSAAHDLRWKTSYFEVALPCHSMLTYTLMIY